jgi:hypothetical protein
MRAKLIFLAIVMIFSIGLTYAFPLLLEKAHSTPTENFRLKTKYSEWI